MIFDFPVTKELQDFLEPVENYEPVTITLNDLRELATKKEEKNE